MYLFDGEIFTVEREDLSLLEDIIEAPADLRFACRDSEPAFLFASFSHFCTASLTRFTPYTGAVQWTKLANSTAVRGMHYNSSRVPDWASSSGPAKVSREADTFLNWTASWIGHPNSVELAVTAPGRAIVRSGPGIL